MKRFDKIRAKFNPKRTDDLQNEADKCIGEITEWMASWKIEDGPYGGQWAMMPLKYKHHYFGWAPECDLEIIE